jgi:signal transduction histidine kinase/ActR/RegA family two-component response regulator
VTPARPTSIRRHFIGLVLIGVVPVSLFAGLLLYQLWSLQREQVRSAHLKAVESIADSVARELQTNVRRLELLALSPLLDERPPARFRAFARTVLADSPEWRNLLLIAPSGEQVFNLAAEPDRPLPALGERPHRRAVLETRRPAVSDLFVDRTTGEPSVEVTVPVIRDGTVRYLLAAPLNLRRLEQLLLAQIAKEEVAALMDGRHVIVARSRDGPAFIGKPPVPALHADIQRAPSGWAGYVTFEGDAVYSAWARVPGVGWTTAFGIPAAPIDQALTRSLLLLGGIGLGVLAGGCWLALAAARRAAAGIHAAAAGAGDLAAGRPIAMRPTGIAELDGLGEALRAGSARLSGEADERASAERERNALLERVQAENRAKDEFLAMLGHELRNPLAAISNAARVLERTAPAEPGVRHAVDVINRQAAHQARLLNDLLDIGRVVLGKIPIQRSALDLAEVVRRALAAIEAAGGAARHRIETALSPVWLQGDPTRLEQVVANLVGNALKFTPAGGTIRVVTARDGDHAVLTVRDDGAGIAPELLPRIFDLFVQGEQESARGAGGLGLGLTLVRRLAELHGGTATVASDGKGRGATFTVRLPAIAQPALALAAAAQPKRAAPRRILLVEDNDDVRAMLQTALALDGHQVTAVADGAAALAAADEDAPEVAILDIGLAGMDGYEVALALRARLGPRVRLIALTGYGLAEDRERSGRAGFEAHLVKPVDPAALTEILDRERPTRADKAA